MKKYTPTRIRLKVMLPYLPMSYNAAINGAWRTRKSFPFIEKVDEAGKPSKNYYVNMARYVEFYLARGKIPHIPPFVEISEVAEIAEPVLSDPPGRVASPPGSCPEGSSLASESRSIQWID